MFEEYENFDLNQMLIVIAPCLRNIKFLTTIKYL